MKYKFSKLIISDMILYDIDFDESKFFPITLLRFNNWTPNEVQKLIEGILSTKDSDKDYKYQTEGDGLHIYSNSYAVQFFNLRMRKKESDLKLSHDEFVTFLEDYKAFIEANN